MELGAAAAVGTDVVAAVECSASGGPLLPLELPVDPGRCSGTPASAVVVVTRSHHSGRRAPAGCANAA